MIGVNKKSTIVAPLPSQIFENIHDQIIKINNKIFDARKKFDNKKK